MPKIRNYLQVGRGGRRLMEWREVRLTRTPAPQGQVLRLRKTEVGATTSRDELILRAKKDEEFFKNVARPFLSPLLTDESHLVLVEPEALVAFKRTVEARRPERRRHKEINEYGVAWICPDAASTFTERRLSDASSLTPLRTSPLPRGRPSPSSEGRGVNPKDSPRTLRESQPASSSTNKSLRGVPMEAEASAGTGAASRLRPLEGEASSEWAEARLRSMPEGRPGAAKVVCVEIKPKQGYVDHSTAGLPMCVFCINQYHKPEKCRDRSSYCPQDLFSGDLTRMRRAVDALIQTPQTNLKVFVDGEAVEDIREYGYLRDVLISALTHDFDGAGARFPPAASRGGLSRRSPLGRTLAFQMLDQLGVRRANALYRSLADEMGGAREADAAIHDLRCWTGDGRYCQGDEQQVVAQCGRCWHNGRMASLEKADEEGGRSEPTRNGQMKAADTQVPFPSAKSETRVIPALEEDEGGRDSGPGDEAAEQDATTRAEKVRRLQEFLLATTAKDLSLMILLNGPHAGPVPPCSSGSVSPFSIELPGGVWYLCQVTAVDLIAKPPNKIRKREKDHKKQLQVLRDLLARGEEPTCCKC